MKPDPKKTVIELVDHCDRGNIVIEQIEPRGPYQMWIQMSDVDGHVWEDGGVFKTLPETMADLAEIININNEHEFYED